MGRSPSSSNKDNGVKRGPWSPEEDKILIDYVEKHGQGSWKRIAERSGLNRCGKSCRLRWTNYLRPDIKRGGFSDEEEAAIIKLHGVLGNKWSRIAAHFPGRTDNEIKNFWNTSLRKKLLRLGIDPKTHKPVSDLNLLLSSSNLSNLMNPLDPALILRASATEMAKIKVQLQNLLHARNSSLLPYVQGISQLRDFIILNGLINGANTNNIFQPQAILADLSNIFPVPNEYPSTANSLRCFEGEISPGLQDNKIRSFTNVHNSNYSLPSLVSATPEASIVNPLESFEGSKGFADKKIIGFSNMHNSEYSLPSLVSVTPESSNVNQFESANKHIIPTRTLDSDAFDPWDIFVDDEASSSIWKDILG